MLTPQTEGSEPCSTILPKRTRLEQPSAKDTGICKAPFTFFQICPVKAFPCVRAAHCMALPSLLLAAFVFVAGLEWGNLSLQLRRTGTWVHMDGPRGASGSSCVQQRKDWAMDFVRISEVQLFRSPSAEISLQKSVRNKYKVRNCLQRSGPTGFELPDTCTCSLVGTWLFPGSGQVLGLE